jgi:hypothetical protein
MKSVYTVQKLNSRAFQIRIVCHPSPCHADPSNDALQALPHPNNSVGLSHNPTGQVVEVPGALDGSLYHSTRHKVLYHSSVFRWKDAFSPTNHHLLN